MILAAGLGTRLGPLTSLRPKPMLPICGTPLVRWAALWLRSQGVREIVVNLHHLGEQIAEELGDGGALDLDIRYSREAPEVLGTGGGIRRARALLDDGSGAPIIIVNGKILLDLDLADVLRQHRETGAEATLVLCPDPRREKWEKIRLGPDRQVVSLFEETREGSSPGRPLMFTGVHVIDPKVIDRIPGSGAPCIVRSAYRELFAEGRGLYGYLTDGYWWEHSNLERYLVGLRKVLDGEAALPYAERPLRGVDPTAKIHPTAKIRPPVFIGRRVEVGAGAEIGPYVELDDDVIVDAGVRLRDVIAWPGAHVRNSAERAVAAGERLLDGRDAAS